VAIARALANNPTIVLADEPTGNLDSKTGRSVVELMQKLNRERGVTFIIVTHDMEVADMTKRIVQVRDGRIVSDDHRG
ncbi:MAG: ABC transporter ATP-binding protein, partial [Thermoproteota archaeon]